MTWWIEQLRTNGCVAPMAVPRRRPVLSWVPCADRNGARQTGFRVRVGTAGRELWDSGDRTGEDTRLAYAGPGLADRTRYTWNVTVRDDEGEIAHSSSWFETCPDDDSWGQARWIGPDTRAIAEQGDPATDRGAEPDPDALAAPLLRREVDLPDQPVTARLYVAGLGLHRCTINGQRVTDAELESGATDYDHTVLYSVYDVTGLLHPGPVVLGVELGRGWYDLTTPNVWRWHQAPWRGRRRLLLRLEVVDAHGDRHVVTSDEEWRWTPGPTRFDSLYEGETFDARHDPAGWDEPGFDATAWRPVRLLDPPRGRLVPQTHEPVRVCRELPVRRWHRLDGGGLVADLGETVAGWARVDSDRLPEGTRLTLTFGEQLDDRGAVEAENVHIHTDRFQRDEVVVGDRPLRWQRRFGYAGFRYVQLDGVEDHADLTVTGLVAHTEVASAGSFHCSDPVLTWIDAAMRRTVANNLHHLPTDTPMYEKNGWTGDAQVAAVSMLYAYDLRALLGKWLDDLADSQELSSTGPRSPDGIVQEGRLPVIAPSPGWGYVELAPAPEWTTVYPYLLDLLTRWYDDLDLPLRHLDAVLWYLDHEIGRLDAAGLSSGVLGDYLAPGFGGPPDDDLRIAASCYLHRALVRTADLIDAVADRGDEPVPWQGRCDDLRAAAAKIATAVNTTFLDTERGVYRGPHEQEYRQTSNVLPLAMGITPDEHVPAVVAGLVADLHAHDDHHNVGCLGASELLRVLTAHGHADLAIRVATQTTPPSWGAWQAAGETTMREMWDERSRSHDHYFMGSVAQWLYESVAGVRMLEPGWRTFAVDPAARTGIDHAGLRLQTVRGEIAAAWRRDGDTLAMEITVPVGCRARVHLPGQEPRWVECGTWQLSATDVDLRRA